MLGFLAYGAVVALMRLVSWLPLRAALAIGSALGAIAYHVLRVRRSVVLGNIRHVFGDRYGEKEIRRLAARSYREFGRTIIEVLRDAVRDPDPGRSEFTDVAQLLAWSRERVPLIVCVPHCGNIDSLGNDFAGLGLRYHVIMRPLKNRRLSELLKRSRERRGAVMHFKGSAAFLEFRTLLRDGEIVVILPDQNARTGAVEIEFLGKPASTFKSPALLHLATGARLVVAVDTRSAKDPTRHLVRVIYLPDHRPTGDQEADVRAIMQRINDAMAEAIRDRPDQYFWLHRRWGKAAGAG